MIPKIPKDKQAVKELLEKAAKSLFDHQPDIYEFTPESGETEWNIAHHYANEVSKLLPAFACDVEITKTPQYDDEGRKRPDIILHKRRMHDGNFLVIELKLKRQEQLVETLDSKDAKKIKEHWFREKFRYTFGAQVNFKEGDRSKFKVRVFENKPEKAIE